MALSPHLYQTEPHVYKSGTVLNRKTSIILVAENNESKQGFSWKYT